MLTTVLQFYFYGAVLKGPLVQCGSADVYTGKIGISFADSWVKCGCGLILCAVYSAEAGLLLRTEDCSSSSSSRKYRLTWHL